MVQNRSALKEPGNRQAPEKLVDLLKMIFVGMLSGWKKIVKRMVLIALIVLVIHTYLLVVVNEGFNYDGSNPLVGAMLAMSGRVISGTLFWILLMWIGTLVFTQIKKKGISGMVENFRQTPSWVLSMKERTGDISTAILMGGVGAALVLAGYISNFLVSLLLMLAIIGALVARQESILLLACRLAYSDFMRFIKKAKGFTSIDIAFPTVALSGALGGFLLSIVIGGNFLLKIMGVVLIGISYYMYKQNDRIKPSVVMPMSIFIIAFILLIVPVMADDGGWQESGASFDNWITSEGAAIAIAMGIPPAIAAIIGILLGGATAGGASSLIGLSPDGSDTTPDVTDIPIEDLAPEVDGSVGYVEDENGEWIKVTYNGEIGEWETDAEKVNRLDEESRAEQYELEMEIKRNQQYEERREFEALLQQQKEEIQEQQQEQQRLDEIERIKDKIRLNMEHNQELSKIYQEEGRTMQMLENIFGWIGKGADIGVDILATVTGPVGKSIKIGYTATKNIGKNISETCANDGSAGDYAWAIGKGTLETGFDVGFNELGSKVGKWTGNNIPGFKSYSSSSNWTGKLGNSKTISKIWNKTQIASAWKHGAKTGNYNLYNLATTRRNTLLSDAATGVKNALQSQFQAESIGNPIKRNIGF